MSSRSIPGSCNVRSSAFRTHVGGEAVHAIIVVKAGTTVDVADLIAFCKERIAGYKFPYSVDVRTDPLPMSGAGKILKRELRRPFWEGQERHVA